MIWQKIVQLAALDHKLLVEVYSQLLDDPIAKPLLEIYK